MPVSPTTDDAIVAELGRRLAAHRVARNLTQAQFADDAGVARSTIQRIEGGASIQLSSFVKILRALDRLDALDAVLAPSARSPLADLQRERRRPRRVRPKPAPKPEQASAPEPPASPWTWGDAP